MILDGRKFNSGSRIIDCISERERDFFESIDCLEEFEQFNTSLNAASKEIHRLKMCAAWCSIGGANDETLKQEIYREKEKLRPPLLELIRKINKIIAEL